MSSSLDSTYCVWLVSLLLETLLYGMGILQTWTYFSSRPADAAYVKWTLQLLAASPKDAANFSLSAIGIYTIHFLAAVQICISFGLSSSSAKPRTDCRRLRFPSANAVSAITTLQAAASLACDLLITTYLCLFLESKKGEMIKTNSMMDVLIRDAISRGMLTALSSGVSMVLFLALPDTFWFFLGLAPSSKLYMNSMLTTYVIALSFLVGRRLLFVQLKSQF
ncbi:hypothetical protein B0H13DRAFT_1871016 [Mycena leptocephala]|nr:hypothetical protein B0H13DRAFT_1871016 [Mycena leptocephala]